MGVRQSRKQSVRCVIYGRHHDLVDRYEISIAFYVYFSD